MGAVIAEHFSAKTISMITGYPQLDPVPPVPPRPEMPPQLIMAQIQQQQASQAPMQNGVAPEMPQQAPQQPPNPQLEQLEQQYQQAIQQWQQAMQAAQAVMQANQQKQQQFDAAVQLIKDDGVHGFRIDIEADSTIAPDEQAEKSSRVEFMEKFVPFMEQIVPIATGNPTMAQMAEEMTLFVVRGFRVARPLEETITNAFKALAQMPPPQPKEGTGGPDSPADLAVRTKQVDAQNNKTAATLQLGQQKNALEAAKLAQQSHDSAAKLAADETAKRMEHGLNIAKMQDEGAFRRERAQSLESREATRLT